MKIMWHPFNYLRRSWRVPLLAILFALMVIVGGKTNQSLTPFPMSALELAPNADAAKIIIGYWQKTDHDLTAAHLLQSWDTYFILCYSTFFALACVSISDWLYSSEPNANRLGKLFAWLMWVAGLLDYVENYAINRMLNQMVHDQTIVGRWPTMSSVSALFKFAFIGAGCVYILTSLVVRVLRRSSSVQT